MANPSPSTRFKKGNTHAADNQNQRKKRIKKSALRKTLVKLQELEPHSLTLVEKSVKEESVDRESLQTAKWVLNNLISFTKAAAQDEAEMNGLRWKGDSLEAEEAEKEERVSQPNGAVFSLFVNEAAKKDKE